MQCVVVLAQCVVVLGWGRWCLSDLVRLTIELDSDDIVHDDLIECVDNDHLKVLSHMNNYQ